MLDLGVVKPGSTLRIPFSSFDKDDGSSITMTNYAAADILIYKDGSTTERASTSGFTATTDFDGKTGKHLAIIDLSDDTTADFFKAGSEYLVAIDAVTVDAVTTGGWIARFSIGYPNAILNTSIATLSTQTSFTLTTGPAEDNALNGCVALIHDKASAVQCGFGVVSAYTGSTKTVTLTAGVSFTAAAIDNISFFPPSNVEYFHALAVTKVPLAPTTAGRDLDVSATGEAGVDWANVGGQGTTVNLSATTTNVVNTASAVTTLNGIANNVITAASIAADAITDAKVAADVTIASVTGAVGSVTSAVTVGTNNDKTGYALTAAYDAAKTASQAGDQMSLVTAVRPGIRKNTALLNFEILMTDSTNHLPATGKTVTVTRSIDHGAFGAGTLGAVTELSNGIYYFDFGAGDLNGDVVTLLASATGCDDLFLTIRTTP